MKKSREEVRQELKQKVEELLEETLDWYEEQERPTFGEIENKVLNMRQRLSEEVTRALVEGQETRHPSKAPNCPKCQRRMHYKGEKGKGVTGLIGEIELKRAYYYCPKCKEGIFPPR